MFKARKQFTSGKKKRKEKNQISTRKQKRRSLQKNQIEGKKNKNKNTVSISWIISERNAHRNAMKQPFEANSEREKGKKENSPANLPPPLVSLIFQDFPPSHVLRPLAKYRIQSPQ